MTKLKKVVAMLLAFLMIFSSASVLASAWDVAVDDGSTLEISTKFFKEVNGEWVETQKVAPGSTVKARVYLATDYYSNDSDLLFFYDKDFFTHSYGEGQAALEVNTEAGSFAADNKVTGYLKTNSDLSDYVDASFLNDYAGFAVTLKVGAANNVMFDDSTWLFEFTLTVLDEATGEGNLFVEESTIQTTTNYDAKISVPKGPADGTDADTWPMWLWDATPVLSSSPVSTLSSVTFNANDGEFADGSTEVVRGTDIGDEVIAPDAPERAGYTFMGWIDAADDTPTLEEAKATVVVDAIPENAIVYNAFWLKNVNITFNTDGGSDIAPIENVTPYTDFAAVADPTKAGYTFVGWDVRDGKLPATYPDVDTEYTAIWALNVTVSFDTDGGTEIPSVDGYAGADFTETIPNPKKEGHRFVMWSPALPTVFPEADTTYNAIFETKIYSVYYFVDGKIKATVELEYGSPVPTNVTSVKAPEGYELTGWHTDAACTADYAGGTMGTETINLYTKTQPKTYNAIFMSDGEVYDTIPTVYDSAITAPATDPTKAGYIFTGWSPDVKDAYFSEANDMYFYATWTEAERNVEYYSDGALYETFNIETGAEIDVPADAYKEGYTFLGWADTEGATSANVTFPQTMPTLADGEVVKYYAVFEINEYTVTWDVDGATTEETYAYGATINAPADPEKEGYTFAGWDGYTDGDKMGAADATFTAQWNINQYTVTWIVDGSTIEETEYDYGETIVVPADPEKAGYVFNGWDPAVVATMGAADVTYTATWANATDTPYTIETYKMAADGSYGAPETTDTKYGETGKEVTASYTEDAGFQLDAANSELTKTIEADGSTVLKVYLARLSYKVTTDVDGVTSEVADVLYGAVIAEPAAPANKEGHTFAGWAEYTDGMTMPVGGQTFTATWTVNEYTVTWDVDGATTEETYAYGATINAPADPEKEGYTFAGWSPAVPATQGAADATYTATWTVNEYTVTWDVDGKTTEETYAYGATINAPADPEKEGHTFAGWSPAVPATQGAADATYTATWTVNEYTVTWDVDGKTTEETYAYGATINAPADPEKVGYTFAGWSPAVPATQGAADATYTATWVPAGNTYKVETYLMDTEGNYGDPTVEVKSADTESEVTAAHEAKEGFTPAESGNVLEGVVAADGSTTLKLYYVRNQYTFKTVVDGVESSETYYYDAAVTAPADPVKAGYDFAGWDGTVPAKMPANDVTLTAKWTESTDTEYKVIINYNDGANADAPATVETVLEGTTNNAIVIVDEIPADPAADTEYVLWSTLTANWADAKYYEFDENAANDDIAGGIKVAADGSTVINVYYTPVLYTATFNAGDGSFEGGEKTATAEVDHFDLVKDNVPAVNPTREGYSFGGWNGVTDTLTLSSNREFIAKWNVNSYTVTWDVDGATSTSSVVYNTAIPTTKDPSKEGHTFAGWSWTKTENSDSITAPSAMPAYDVTATATWTVNEYTVTWDVDGKTTEETYAYGATINAPANPEKEGHTFAGWSPAVPATQGAADATYTATWTVNEYTVTWDVDGKTTEETYAYGATINAPADPEKEGHTFAGWSPAVPATQGAADATYTATWTVNEYTVTWDVDGATTEETYAYGATINAPADPEKEGHTFAGWAPEVPATQGAADATYTATWTVNKYNAIFNAEDGTLIESVPTEYNKAPVAPTAPAKEGYGFAGWKAADGTVYASSALPVMGAADVTYTATYTAGAVNYKVETYIMDTEGNYGAADSSETKSGTADTEATVAHEAKTGFTADTANSVLSGNIAADGSLVLKLYYSRNQYALSTDVDGTVTKVADYYYDAVVAEPAAPANKEGHTFAGWDGYTAGMKMPAEATTVTAKWDVNNYTVTWDVDGKTTEETYAYGATINVPADPEKEGHTFAGWSPAVPATQGAADATYIAQWTVNEYTVTWDVDGKTTEETYAYGATINAPADPEKEGYTFAGWSPAVPATQGAADATYTATWTVNEYTVTWDVDGATTEETYAYGATINAPADPSKEGHTFAGWSPAVPATQGIGDATYTATWTVNEYDLVYMSYNGVYKSEKVAYGTTIVLPEEPTREGYTFTGWDGYSDGMTMPAAKTTFGAKWSLNSYTVTWDVDGATTEETYAYGATINAPADPEKEGHTFAGWSPAVPATQGAADATYKATWTVNEYTVTWDVDGKTTEETYAYGATINAPADPEKEGYTFAGWSPAVPATQGAADATYTATWTVNEYTVTWDVDGKTTEETYAYGATINAPADPEKEGYTFAGWTPAVPATQGVGDATYTATWTVNEYTVTWVIDGETYDTETYAYGAAITAPVPEKAGYTFSGWSPSVPATQGAADATYTGSWIAEDDIVYTIETYIMDTEGAYGDPSVEIKAGETDSTVSVTPEEKVGFTLDAEGSILEGKVEADGSLVLEVYYIRNQYAFSTDVDGTVTKVADYYYDAEVAEPAAPANKEGHTFAGWDGYTAGMKMPAEATTVTAKWDVNNYTVTWDVDGATTEETYAYGATINAPADPEKEGHTFAGWSPAVPATQGAADATYKATWTVNEYTVTWDVDGKTTEETYAYGATINAPADPEKEGYTFTGWTPAVPATQGAADATYTAQWQINKYTVTYANTGDSTIASVEADYGTAIDAVEDPIWAGYTFRGWKWTDADGAEISAPATIPAYNVTATAQWTANNYTITWIVDGATTAIDNYDFGADITAPAAPEKAGYTFAGWSWTNEAGEAVTSSATMPAYNVIATAQWNANGDTAYTVEIYKMATDGVTYEKVDTVTGLTGATGATATYVVAAETGFTVNADMTTGYAADANTASAEIAGDGSTVIKVYYDRNKVEIEINDVTDEYYYGEEIPEPTKPTPPVGYEQDPENPWVDENGDPVEFPFTVDEDNPSEIKPNYKKLSYDIAWTIDGVTTTQTYEFEAAVTAPEIPAKAGYRVVGWVDAAGKLATVPATMPATDLAYTALYETLVYGVNYYVDGKLVSTVSSEYGAAVQSIKYEAPMGYTFDGWYTDEEMTVELADDATVTAKETSLYGKTVANIYEAVFMVDGEVYDTVETAFDAQIIAPVDPTKEGYTFTGWTPDVALMDEEGKTFTATWEETADAYSVTYMMGTEADAATFETFKHAIGEEVDVPADPYKEGHIFAGWVDADGNAVEIAKTMPAENLTYYASWTVIEYTVTWDVDGETTEETYAYGETINAPADPEKEGHTFAGWNGYTDGMTMPAENLTFTATWTTDEYTVTWDVDGVTTEETYAYGATINAPADPEKEGFEFAGWDGYTDGMTMPAEDLTFTATWTEVEAAIPVKLVPVAGSTTMIERDGIIESYNDGYTVITDEYGDYVNGEEDSDTYAEWYIYGLKVNFRQRDIASYFTVQGDGRMEVDTTLSNGGYGTGAVVKVYDQKGTPDDTSDDEFVEQFYIIIFGDVDGNARINATDTTMIKDDVLAKDWSNNRTGIPYMKKAASIDGNTRVTSADSALHSNVVLKLSTLDQVTGKTTAV